MFQIATKVLIFSASLSAAAKAEAKEEAGAGAGAGASPAAGGQPEHRELYAPKPSCGDCHPEICKGKYGDVPADPADTSGVGGCAGVDNTYFVTCVYEYCVSVQQCAPGTVFNPVTKLCDHPKFEDIEWEPYCIDHVEPHPGKHADAGNELATVPDEYIPSPCGTDGKELYFPEYYGDSQNFIQCEPTTGKCYRKMCMPNKDAYIPTFWYEGGGYYTDGACTYPYNIPKDSCTDRCGYYDPNLYCQCDESCSYHGDCCYDYRGQCLPHTCSHLPKHDSCQDKNCIYDNECDCQCDYYCKAVGDCCDDAPDYCYVGGLGDGLGIEEVGERFGEARPERGGGGGEQRRRNRRAERTDREIAERNGRRPVRHNVDGVRRERRNE